MEKGLLMTRYWQEIQSLLNSLLETQQEAVLTAASMVAEQIKQDRLIHVFGPGGHSNLAAMEIFYRAGGLMHINAMLDQETVLSAGALRSTKLERLPGYGRILVEDHGIGSGDLLWIVNPFGINAAVIDAALTAREHGAKILGVSSRRCAEECPPDHPARHPSGYNLHEIVDLHVDSGIRTGDAVMDIPGVSQKVGALSTFANAFLMYAIVLEAIGSLAREGIEPPIWKSSNCPGGDAWNSQFLDRFRGAVRCL